MKAQELINILEQHKDKDVILSLDTQYLTLMGEPVEVKVEGDAVIIKG